MIEIDGIIGGGQVLRTAIALSALTLKPIKIINIRKNRAKVGLMPQHLMGVKIAGEFCNAEIRGALPGSTEVEFVPKSKMFSNKKIDIGTAGSISLLLQTLTPILIFSERIVDLEIVGGTAGLGAPTIEYLKFVMFPILSKLGIKQPSMEIVRQGFYPKGQGFVRIRFYPTRKLFSMKLLDPGKVKNIKGISVSGSLPKTIADRQVSSAKKILWDHGYRGMEISSQYAITASHGTSITLWAECENTILGASSLGKLGKPAEKVGEEAATELIASIESKKFLDKFMSDQIIPFTALAEGKSEVSVEKITEHCETNIRVMEQILGVKFEIDKQMKKISVNGIGFQR